MLELENVKVENLERAVAELHRLMGSSAETDSRIDGEVYALGENDLALYKKLVESGKDRTELLRAVTVTADIVAPLYWWNEFDVRNIGTVETFAPEMDKIHEKEFTIDDFSCEDVEDDVMATLVFATDTKGGEVVITPYTLLQTSIVCLNHYRDTFLEYEDNDYEKERLWYYMLQLLPASYNQKRTVTMSYDVLNSIYTGLEDSHMEEWGDFFYYIEKMPFHELIIT